MPIMTYVSIPCSLHDQYLAWATLRFAVEVIAFDEAGIKVSVRGIITDVFTERSDRSEWMVMDSGQRIRLDRITSVQEVAPG